MNKCLVTKFNISVDNDYLQKVGQLTLNISKVSDPTSATQGFHISADSSKEIEMEIIGNGYFTDASLSANKGKNLKLTGRSAYNVYFSNGDYSIAVYNKYAINYLWLVPTNVVSKDSDFDNKGLDISDLKYSELSYEMKLSSNKVEGDIIVFSEKSNIKNLNISRSKCTGNISAFKNLANLTSLNISSTDITGDISSLSSMKSLNTLNFDSSKVYGDLSSLSSLIHLKTSTESLFLNNVNITGDISALRNFDSINFLYIQKSVFSGDLSQVPSNLKLISATNYKGDGFNWTSRDNSANIFAIEGNPIIIDLDKMLQDLSLCQKAFQDSDGAFMKRISVIGTRTSASDAAVATLQSKGYTVSITPA